MRSNSAWILVGAGKAQSIVIAELHQLFRSDREHERLAEF
jgi:hypothetical protein